MGIYRVKSNTCGCIGSWSTLDPNDRRIYMETPCMHHRLKEGNVIYYELKHFLKDICINDTYLKDKYAVKIIDVIIRDRQIIINIEYDNTYNTIDTDNLEDQFKTLRWKKREDNKIQFLVDYHPAHHTIEDSWI